MRLFGKNLVSIVALRLQHFPLAADINLKLLYLLLMVSYQLTSGPTTYMLYTTN